MKSPFGRNKPCFIIAEAGVNHNGSLARAKEMVEVAAASGADAVKFQTFRAEALASADAPLADYMKKPGETAPDQLTLLKSLEFSDAQFAELKAYCEECGIRFMSTAFDEASADMLDALGMDVVKVPSGELTNIPFLRHLARKGRATILSTGMGTLGEVEAAVETLTENGAGPLAILHCVSAYPTPPSEVNLRAMDTLGAAFHLPVGFSDHTLGFPVAWAAVARGACILEKHFTLDRSLPGPDHAASLEPDELKTLVQGVRDIESCLGDGRKRPTAAELNTKQVARRSVVLTQACPAGTVLTEAHVGLRRPAGGIEPADWDRVVGRTLRQDVPAGHRLAWGDLQ